MKEKIFWHIQLSQMIDDGLQWWGQAQDSSGVIQTPLESDQSQMLFSLFCSHCFCHWSSVNLKSSLCASILMLVWRQTKLAFTSLHMFVRISWTFFHHFSVRKDLFYDLCQAKIFFKSLKSYRHIWRFTNNIFLGEYTFLHSQV